MLNIHVGGLESVPSVYYKTSSALKEFNALWHSGRVPEVVWDLRGVSYGKINVAATSFFLALAHRVRQYTDKPQRILIDYHPKIFSFLSEIKFFKTASAYDLFSWPYAIGGFSELNINPNTQIVSLDRFSDRPDIYNDEELSDWKRLHREKFREGLVLECSELFQSVYLEQSEKNLPLVVSRICAEVAINSLLWGEATAFIGLQRSRNLIIISVVDVGKGFKQSFFEKNIHQEHLLNEAGTKADLRSCVLASVTNKKNFGLKRAIENVVNSGGNISISSGAVEINWGQTLWSEFINNYNSNGFENAVNKLGEPEFKVEKEKKKSGFIRKWKYSIRGVRVTFSIPLNGGNQ